MKNYAIHLCIFRGKLSVQKARGRCDINGCKKKAWRWALFPWGPSKLCRQHVKEECGT